MPLPHLATELWQQILEQVIFLPTFLNFDGLSEVVNPLYDANETNDSYSYVPIHMTNASNVSNLFRRVGKGIGAGIGNGNGNGKGNSVVNGNANTTTNNNNTNSDKSKNRTNDDFIDSDRCYWKMERQRNTLQRVCKSWDAYLRRFEHRYVTLTDVIHGVVPEKALSTAIRIGHGVCMSENPFCCLGKRSVSHYVSIIKGLVELGGLERIEKPGIEESEGFEVRESKGLSVEIVDASGPSGWLIPELLIEMHQYMPHLKAIISAYIKHPYYDKWAQLISGENLPNLKFVSFTECTDYNFSSRLPSVYQGSNTLETFSCVTTDYDPFTISMETGTMPSLRDLRFPRIAQGNTATLINLLQKIGSNLTSLQLGRHKSSSRVLPREVWELCPRLERLDCSFTIHYPTPPNHSLHTLSTSMPTLRGTTVLKVNQPFQSSVRGWSSLRRLILQGRWDQCTEMEPLGLLHWAYDLFRECNECGVVLEDITGNLFQDSGFELGLLE